MTIPANSEYRLDLGGTVIAIHCNPAQIGPGLARWFARASSDLEPHIKLELEVIDGPYESDLPTSLLTTKSVTAEGKFRIADDLITGEFDPVAGSGLIRANEVLFKTPLVRILEQIFYQAFYSARQFSGLDSFLVHSSAVVSKGNGFLFVGPSEAGKTTAARCSSEFQVLGDEMNLVIRTVDGFVVEGTGFNGLFREKSPGRAPLKAIFLLKQAPKHALLEIPYIDATMALAAEIVPPIGLDKIPNAETLPFMVDAADEILQGVPARYLEFKPDPGFWPLIHREFGSNTDQGTTNP
ncbi:MAG: hypothetical protein KOO60_09955 [Gemmatimonadales bacterium]|nr:hypothetical protein [Gemmatimonadales bacterium]